MKKIKIVALLAAVITAVLLYFFLSSLDQSSGGGGDSLSVVTASVDIPANTAITEEMITVVKLPSDAVLGESVSDTKLVSGKVAKIDIFAGEQIIKNKLITAGDAKNDDLAYLIKPGMRAISIAVDSTTGLAGMLKPNYIVDIISDFDREQNGVPVSYNTMIAEGITILAVDSVLSVDGTEQTVDGNGDAQTGDGNSPYSTITLEVTPQQAMELSLSEYKGHLRAILRSPLDEKKTNLPTITLDSVIVN